MVDQEVVYDSANDAAQAADISIKDEINRVSGERFLRNCFKEEFLELICLLVKNDTPS